MNFELLNDIREEQFKDDEKMHELYLRFEPERNKLYKRSSSAEAIFDTDPEGSLMFSRQALLRITKFYWLEKSRSKNDYNSELPELNEQETKEADKINKKGLYDLWDEDKKYKDYIKEAFQKKKEEEIIRKVRKNQGEKAGSDEKIKEEKKNQIAKEVSIEYGNLYHNYLNVKNPGNEAEHIDSNLEGSEETAAYLAVVSLHEIMGFFLMDLGLIDNWPRFKDIEKKEDIYVINTKEVLATACPEDIKLDEPDTDDSKEPEQNSNNNEKTDNIDNTRESIDTTEKKAHNKKIIKRVLNICGAVAFICVIVAGLIYFSFGGKLYMKKGKDIYFGKFAGVENNQKARKCFNKAAKFGEADAYYYLGNLDLREYKYDDAKVDFETGYNEKSALSEMGLGTIYELTDYDVVVTDYKQARSLFEEALSKGCVEANYYIGNLKRDGFGGYEQDVYEAMDYYNLALNSDSPEIKSLTKQALGDLYANGYYGLEQDFQKALDYYEDVIDIYPADTYIANYKIGLLYDNRGDDVYAAQYYDKANQYLLEAEKYEDAKTLEQLGFMYYYKKGVDTDYEDAEGYFQRASEYGNTESMNYIAEMYRQGNFYNKNYNKAIEWYEKSKNLGNTTALVQLGLMYDRGEIGVKEDGETPAYNVARQLFNLAADSGNGDACAKVAEFYRDGKECEQSYKDAVDYCKTGIKYGSSDAMWFLGTLYWDGKTEEGIVNKGVAKKWFEKSAYLGNKDGMRYLAKYYEEVSDEENAEETAFLWYLKAAEAGDLDAMYKVGIIYRYNKEDYEKAEKWFQKASLAGNNNATVELGKLYDSDVLGEPYYEKAEQEYKKVADENISASFLLARLYASGKLGAPNYKDAEIYYTKAAEAGDSVSMNSLANLYYNGDLGSPDYDKAKDWYEEAALKGNRDAMYNMGSGYFFGHFEEEKNYNEAKKWYCDAAYLGDLDAIDKLIFMHDEKHIEDKEYADIMDYLGARYLDDEFEDRDPEIAVRCYEQAADSGSESAIAQICEYYYHAEEIENHFEIAESWALKGVEQDNVYCIDWMGYISCNVKKDYSTALDWYSQSAEKGDTYAMLRIADIYSGEYDKSYANEELYLNWLVNAVNAGCAEEEIEEESWSETLDNIANYYLDSGNYEEASKWYGKAIDLGDIYSEDYQDDIRSWVAAGKVRKQEVSQWI